MKGARKSQPPREFTDWLNMQNADWKPSYPFNSSIVRQSVIDCLHEAQRGLCVYCGKELDMRLLGKSYHVEHFRPQHSYPELSVSFDNIFLNCGQEDEQERPSKTCGTKKENWFDEAEHIFPDYPDCIQRFNFTLNGEVRPKDENDSSALTMISVLNLNHDELVKDRETVHLLIDSGELNCLDYWNEHSRTALSLAYVAYWKCGDTIP